MRLFVCFALIVVCSAQVPSHCESPKQWTGRRVRGLTANNMDSDETARMLIANALCMVSRVPAHNDRYKQFFEYAGHVYDEENFRTYSKEELDVGRERDYYLKIHLYNEGLNYTMNLKTKQCTVSKITHPFRRIGVPQDARFLFEGEYGAAGIPAEHFVAATFGGKFEDGAEYLVTVAEPNCIPIDFDIRSNTTMEHYSERYFDFHIGISDPAVFIPPKECMMIPVPP